MDMIAVAGKDKGKTFKGIYRLSGDTLTICTNTKPDGNRPSRFAAEAGSFQTLTVLVRQATKDNPAQKPKTPIKKVDK
jgi:hypothetical protein